MHAIGIDFGTTNTVLAVPESPGKARILTLTGDGETAETVRTALSFRRSPKPGAPPAAEAGLRAIRDFLDLPEEMRFLQSFKSFAASASFSDTAVFTRRFSFEDILKTFLLKLNERTGTDRFPPRLVIGRPVKFAGESPDDSLAMRRYETALRAAGFEDISYVLEPVAAAYFYAQQLKRDSVILVGDFGGGTSDFSVLRFSIGQSISAEALGHSGIGIAGDSFDYRIIENLVSPKLGKHATYVSWGKKLPVPIHYFACFSRWNELCLMRRPDVLRELCALARRSPSRAELLSLVDLIEGGVSYERYRTIAKVKAQLSENDEATFRFTSSGANIEASVKRRDFETWITGDLSRIEETVDAVLASAHVKIDDIDRVLLAGGTSHVPAARRLFKKRFPKERIDSGEQLLSIAKGLALIGASAQPHHWANAS